MTFKELELASQVRIESLTKYKLAIIGDCSTQHLSTAITKYCRLSGIDLTVFDANYNQIFAQTMNPQSELYSFKSNSVLIQMCSEKLYESFCNTSQEKRISFADDTYRQITETWSYIQQYSNMTILQCNFPLLNDMCFGQQGNHIKESFLYQQRKLNFLLSENNNSNVFIIDLDYIQSVKGRNSFFDSKLYYLTKMPIAIKSLPDVAKLVADKIQSLIGKVKKCIILDLDNTLWGGVIGDHGINGIQLGGTGIGQTYVDFQKWLKELKNRGIILTVCSKNNENIAKEPFLTHPDMVLTLDDITVFKSNWENKTQNILEIQNILNIGLDSFVFIDDNPFERELVKTTLPLITVPELPKDPSLYVQFLQSLNLFEISSYSEENKNKTLQYKQQEERIKFESSFIQYEEYLKNLHMQARITNFEPFYYSRLAELSQKSNQFNMTTIRHTENEIEQYANNNQFICLQIILKDKFGNMGLISYVILEKLNDSILRIKEWVMSCRVLKRTVEEFILNYIIKLAKNNNYTIIQGEYYPTIKNVLVQDLYCEMGFTRIDQNNFRLKLSDTIYNTFIEENTLE